MIWEQKFEWVTLSNYSSGIDDRAALVYFSPSLKEIKDHLDESQHLYPAVNVVFFHLDSKQAQENITKQFKIKKFPAVLVKPINQPFDAKHTLNFKIDTDIDDIVEEVYDLFKNTVLDIAEKTVASRML